jgi:hypothetical protein
VGFLPAYRLTFFLLHLQIVEVHPKERRAMCKVKFFHRVSLLSSDLITEIDASYAAFHIGLSCGFIHAINLLFSVFNFI